MEQLLKQKREAIQSNLKELSSKPLVSQPTNGTLVQAFQTKAKEYQELQAYAKISHADKRKRLNQAARKVKIHNNQLKREDKDFVHFLQEQLSNQSLNRFPKEAKELSKEIDLFLHHQKKLQKTTAELQKLLTDKLPLSLLDSLLDTKLADKNNSLLSDKSLSQNEQALKEKKDAFQKSAADLPSDMRLSLQKTYLNFPLPDKTSSPILPLKEIRLQDN